MIKGIIILFLAYSIILKIGFVGSSKEREEIKKKILSNYDASVPPIFYSNDTHETFLGLTVLRIRDLDERRGILIVECALFLLWSDQRLFWENKNVRKLYFEPEQIWVPSVNILNRVIEDEVTLSSLPVAVKTYGALLIRVVLKTACIPDLKYFPFDTQVCEIIMVFITNEGDVIRANYSSVLINNVAVNTEFAAENIQWSLLNAAMIQKRMKINDEEEHEVAVFMLTIKRSMPLVPLAILSPSVTSVILLLATFWMKAGSAIRTGINLTSMLVTSTSLFALGRILPATGSSTPIIVEYAAVALILSAISSLEAFLMAIISRCTKPPPLSYATILLNIPGWAHRVLCINSETNFCQPLDQSFLFSELSELDDMTARQTEETMKNVNSNREQQLHCDLWDNHIILFDRFMFYGFGIIHLFYVLSVFITE